MSVPESALGPTRRAEKYHPLKIILLQGNLLAERVDAIVNPANESLLGGGGLDGMIHGFAGPELLKECETLNGCETGNAKITKGYRLPASHVIHAVGPIYPDRPTDRYSEYFTEYLKASPTRRQEIEQLFQKDVEKARELLLSVHKNILRVAQENGLKRISIPAISTGIFGYPTEDASKVAHQAVFEYLRDYGEGSLEEIRFVLYETEKYNLYEKAFSS
ncbi:hypothetical protein A2866_01630 [Candidatus Roizmanbacteria bacterium RIFCSPHIGHO2_01_FULL_39_8]|uniref:Macro domain-containing protein n=3 Tax=Candidatus Roizmaniibacteriota TaxID=1752723 RepID=A0A1F7GMF2_9BACT|nr:MAG: hypothetical protein A2866_01630 [Candidatus Roizmanbacteria bacterium RIFCSPHIGHO2_01_FULL_39_8]OGK28022.1 MAG: hypothetical protein A3C28_02835 [Candidatus Roizmanbacteria bacterium RIFCSPHIGHO2_02_FULL_39_9]OGK36785.1 MAG: hypothetical protein A3F60_01435 [Candidatus Roizmanbacteria bacterium RIFCSPHIGHO2_12_FULL_39_8]